MKSAVGSKFKTFAKKEHFCKYMQIHFLDNEFVIKILEEYIDVCEKCILFFKNLSIGWYGL